ncbi:MAG: 50S ribosomal protein L24 [Candidatus Aenigmatarchaeota archaeon]
MKTKKPDKQRKRAAEAPMHRRQKKVSAILEKDLRDDFGRRSLPLRNGDEVKVMRGDFKGKEDEVRGVDLKNMKVTLENLENEKVDGTEVRPKIDPSNLMILEPDLSDREREEIIKRSGGEVSEEFKKTEEEEVEEEEEKTEEEGFKCEICGDTFDSKQGLNVHKGKAHPDYMKS